MFLPVSLVLTGLLALWLLHCSGLTDNRIRLVLSMLSLALILFLRSVLYGNASGDYLSFLQPWIAYFRANGGLAALGSYPGNYNPPYMVFLALFSYFDESLDLYLIKTLSLVFDVLLAWACTELLGQLTESKNRLLVCFFAVLCLPTVMLNSSYWAQCDSIYVFFGVWSIALAMKDKPVGAMCALAASLAFKLQAVFILPVFFVFLVSGRIKIKHLFVFPIAYVAYMLPVLLAGMPFAEVMTMYVSDAGTVGEALNYNAPSLTAMVTNVSADALIIAAFAFVALVYAYAIIKRKSLDNYALLCMAVLLAVGIPYLLPHMHDRYFYAAEILTLVLAFASPEYMLMPLLLQLASVHCYCAYFTGHYFVHPKWGAAAVLLVLVMGIFAALTSLQKKKTTE